MKNITMKTKMIVGFLIPSFLLVVNILLSDATTKAAVKYTDPVAQTRYVEKAEIFTAVMAVVSMVITFVIALKLIRAIEKSVAQLSDAAGEIALGHVNGIELVKYNNDEFGKMVDEYTKVIDNIKYQASIAEEISNGNLTVVVKPSSPEDMLGNSLKKLVEDNLHALSNISDAGSQVTISSSQVASASQALAQGSTQQASAIEQITASIDEIAEKTKQNAEQANDAAQLVGKAIDDVKNGNAQMKQMTVAMQGINKASSSISNIIKTIDDIAFQTNILALNAAVEAARAGEAGKGFVVVANEVQTLAGKSSESAKNITKLIEESVHLVSYGTSLSEQTTSALESVITSAEQTADIVEHIAESATSQAQALQQITYGMEQISNVVQTNATTAEESALFAKTLDTQAEELKNSVHKFQLKKYH